MKTFLPGVTTLKERITPEASRQEQQETDLLFECVHLGGEMAKRNYLKEPLTADEIRELIGKYDISTCALIDALAGAYESRIGQPYCENFPAIANDLRSFLKTHFRNEAGQAAQ